MSDFKDQIDVAYKKKVVEKLRKVTAATVLTVHEQLTQTTPVDTGRAKSNWWVENGIVSTEKHTPDNGAAARAQASNASAGYKVGEVAYISNNLPYIRRLNDGYSIKAPAGFVEAAIQIGKLKAQEFAKRLD